MLSSSLFLFLIGLIITAGNQVTFPTTNSKNSFSLSPLSPTCNNFATQKTTGRDENRFLRFDAGYIVTADGLFYRQTNQRVGGTNAGSLFI
jgi:hypothetical protein